MITEKTVEELAGICRLRLTDEERARFADELSALMELVSPLLSIEGAPSVSDRRAASLSDLREDRRPAENDGVSHGILASIKQMSDGYPTVPRTVEE